jgi:hypothetical protein
MQRTFFPALSIFSSWLNVGCANAMMANDNNKILDRSTNKCLSFLVDLFSFSINLMNLKDEKNSVFCRLK